MNEFWSKMYLGIIEVGPAVGLAAMVAAAFLYTVFFALIPFAIIEGDIPWYGWIIIILGGCNWIAVTIGAIWYVGSQRFEALKAE